MKLSWLQRQYAFRVLVFFVLVLPDFCPSCRPSLIAKSLMTKRYRGGEMVVMMRQYHVSLLPAHLGARIHVMQHLDPSRDDETVTISGNPINPF